MKFEIKNIDLKVGYNRDKMDELFPDFDKLGRLVKRLALAALLFAVLATVICAACGR